MLEIQRFVKNMEDRQVVDETKESFLDIENGRIRIFWPDSYFWLDGYIKSGNRLVW